MSFISDENFVNPKADSVNLGSAFRRKVSFLRGPRPVARDLETRPDGVIEYFLQKSKGKFPGYLPSEGEHQRRPEHKTVDPGTKLETKKCTDPVST